MDPTTAPSPELIEELDREEFRNQLRDADRRRDRDPLYDLGRKHGLEAGRAEGYRNGSIQVLNAIGSLALGVITLYLSWKAIEFAFELGAELFEGPAPKAPSIKL